MPSFHASGSRGEAARRQLEPEDDDHHEANREDERAHQRDAGLHAAGDGQARGVAEQRTGKEAADEEVARREGALRGAGGEHRFNNFGRF